MKSPSTADTSNPSKDILVNLFNLDVAGIKAFSQCISLSDILNDDNHRLICADIQNNLKVFKDNVLQSEARLQMTPVGIASFYSLDQATKNIVPFLAVAGGTFIFIYKNLKGTVKFPIPNHKLNAEESAIYTKFAENQIDVKTCLALIKELQNKIANYDPSDAGNDDMIDIKRPLSDFTVEMLNLKGEQKQIDFINQNKGAVIIIKNYITCLHSMKKVESSSKATPSILLVGTETKQVMVIDPSENKILLKIPLPEAPFLVNSTGGYETDHKIFVADRGTSIYIINRSNAIQFTITVPQCMVSMLVSPRNIYIGTIGRSYQSYTHSGTRTFSVLMSNNIITMELYDRKSEALYLTLIATKDKDLRVYKEHTLVYVYTLKDNIFGMKTGRFGSVDDCLVMLTYSGGLMIKTFSKEAKFASLKYLDNKSKNEGILAVPKKTPLYLDMVEREKQSCSDMQNVFQSDLLRVRYKAMDTYVKMLKIGNAPQNYSSSSTMKISASLQGLGPNFKLNIIFDNNGTEPITNAILTLDYNRKIYSFDRENVILGIIMPHISVKYSLTFKNISESGSGGLVKVIVVDKVKSQPLIQTTIKVPISELEML